MNYLLPVNRSEGLCCKASIDRQKLRHLDLQADLSKWFVAAECNVLGPGLFGYTCIALSCASGYKLTLQTATLTYCQCCVLQG